MKILYSIFISVLMVLFFTRCDQLRVLGGGSSGGGVSSGGGPGGHGRDRYGDGGEYGDYTSGGGRYSDSSSGSSGGYDEIYCPADDGDCDDERYSRDYDDLEDKYDGVSGDIEFRGSDIMEDYRTGWRSNYPIEEGRVYVDMSRAGNHRYYSGRIEVAYKVRQPDGSHRVVNQEFSSGYGNDNRYNVWARFGGRLGFHAFFSDYWKGVILVIDEITNVSSERTEADRINLKNQLGSGSIWFKSFRAHDNRKNHKDCYAGGAHIPKAGPGVSTKKCWFISVGPFNCQAWEAGHTVRTFMALEPDSDSCYRKLGDFDGLNISKAFDTDDGDIYIAQ
ncbi:MAG: hypothetical protein OXK80_04135 [Bdellovibrionales bacterium]|nr:hypothetical protein [Bdellovibrionales bacterium]